MLCFPEWSSLAGAAISVHCLPACGPGKSVWLIRRFISQSRWGWALPLSVTLAVRHREHGRAFWVLLELAKKQQGARFEICESNNNKQINKNYVNNQQIIIHQELTSYASRTRHFGISQPSGIPPAWCAGRHPELCLAPAVTVQALRSQFSNLRTWCSLFLVLFPGEERGLREVPAPSAYLKAEGEPAAGCGQLVWKKVLEAGRSRGPGRCWQSGREMELVTPWAL